VDIETHVCTGLDVVNNIAGNITSCEICTGQAKRCLLEVDTHTDLCLDNLLQDASECLLESIRLLFEQFKTFLGTDCLDLVDLEVPKE